MALNTDNLLHASLHNNLPSMVRRYLLGKQNTATQRGMRRGRLDISRIHRAFDDRDDIFYRRGQETAVNAAVSLLVDCSGSMRKNVARDDHGRSVSSQELAFQSAICMADALAIKGCATEVIGFVDNDYTGDLVHQPLKKYTDRKFDVRGQMDMMMELYETPCGNSDGENLAIAYQAILARPEQRKIMIILSDGQPGQDVNSLSSMNAYDATLKTIDMINSDPKVELFAIGFDGFNGLNYKNPKCIGSAKDILVTLMELIKEIL